MKITPCLVIVLEMILLSGCGSIQKPPREVEARTVRAESVPTPVLPETLDSRDLERAADQFAGALLVSGKFDITGHFPVVLRIPAPPAAQSDPSEIALDRLIRSVCRALLQSGKVVTTEVPTVPADAALEVTPYYFLSGRIIVNRSEQGGVARVAHSIELSLTRISTQQVVWSQKTTVAKEASRARVGW